MDRNENNAATRPNHRNRDSFRMKLPFFEDNDDLEDYLRTFERAARAQEWAEEDWSCRLGSLLKGRAREVYSNMADDEAEDYDSLKRALLLKFKLNAGQYRLRFREAKRNHSETTREFSHRIKRYLDRWIEMAEEETGCNDIKQLILLERLYSGIPYDESRFICEKTPKNLDEAIRQAEIFNHAKEDAAAHHQRPNRQLPNARTKNDKSDNNKHVDNRPMREKRNDSRKELPQGNNVQYRKLSCFSCGGEHRIRDCPKTKNAQNNGRSAAAIVQEINGHTHSDRGKLCQLCCQIPFSPECKIKVEETVVSALRDTGASLTIVKADLVPEQCMTSRTKEIVLASSPEKQILPIATIYLDTPYFEGKTEVLVMNDPVCPVLIGNYRKDEEGELHSVSVYPVREVCAAVQTRMAEKKVMEVLRLPVSLLGDVTPKELSEAQHEDATLSKVRKLADSKTPVKEKRGKNHQTTAIYAWRNGILYRIFTKEGCEHRQIVVPKKFRQEVLRLGHDIPMSGHLGISKTRQRIWNHFVWPGICTDVRRYCVSCDICQRCSPRGATRKIPLGKMPIIDTPFERVAVDLIGPILPSSEKGHRYILTMVDYATRYVEAKALKTVKTEEVVENLWEMWTRLGVPREILTDRGSQFVGDLAHEVNKLLSIKGLKTTPWHAQGNGLVEKFNGTIKSMLKHLCQEQPKEWDRYLPAILFAIREVPQESLGFSPFELLFGRTVRGPIQILKELWTKEDQNEETRTTFQYVVDLRNRIEDTCRLARENLTKASKRQAKYFNMKTRNRKFQVGDKVLVLLPNKNKLQMTWKGPYIVSDKLNECDYKVQIGTKEKIYHANILKQYITRVGEPDTHIVAVVMIDESTEAVEESKKVNIPMVSLSRKEYPDDVCISDEISEQWQQEVKYVCQQSNTVLSDMPDKTALAECDIRQEGKKPVFVRQYPLPHSKLKVIGEEVNAMLKLGVIEPAASPYNAPVVLVQKKNGENRFCIDYRKLNQDTIFDAEPMPDIDQLFAKLCKKKYFSKLDLAKGFWQIPMRREDREKTAFTTAQGQFQWITMPFGLKNAGAVFTRMMRKLLRPLDQEAVGNFMDDILIATETWDEHIKIIQQVLERLKECSLTAKPSKCFFGFKTLSFLGHEISEGTIRPEEDKVKKIRDAKPPQTKKELRAFLGLSGYYRKFVPNFASIALPLTDRTKKGYPEHVEWNSECEIAFSELKEKLCQKPVICMPDANIQYVLRTDASNRGIGAVLMQDQGQGLHPAAYASRKLSETETHYSTSEKECLAIVWGIRKFETYLFGTKFVIETDHQPLQYLKKSRTENGRLMRWAIQLQQYSFQVKVIPGKDNVGADYLSRATYDAL